MAESWFALTEVERRETLEHGRDVSGRPLHLLEKDIWVVWTLRSLFDSSLSVDLTFKGGTSLSKAHRVIDRFSEDLDLTYDIRKLIPDLIGEGEAIPASRSQANKWTKALRRRLPYVIQQQIQPLLQEALAREHLDARVSIEGQDNDKLLLHYPALAHGTGYVAPVVTLEFGARATGEPHQVLQVDCDIASHLPGISFPTASPQVMSLTRTFWEKATAAHVFCAKGRIRGHRYARHWHDLAAIARSHHFSTVAADREVATSVSRHKSFFFVEKDADGKAIDYMAATSGYLNVIPERDARAELAMDYAAMLDDELLINDALPFDTLLDVCAEMQFEVNRVAE